MPKPKPKLMNQSEYARHCGVVPHSIYDRVRKGKLTLTDPVKKLIDPIRADKEWADHTQGREMAGAVSSIQAPPSEGQNSMTYAQAKTVREAYAAKTAELDYKEKIRSLVDAKEVEKAAFTTMRKIRDSLLAVADRIDAIVAAETDQVKINHIITKEIKLALDREL